MDATVSNVSYDGWLQLGVAGAVLFILLITIMLIFKQQSASVEKLCTKIDELVTSLSNNNIKLNEVIVANDKDQKEVLRQLDEMHNDILDMHTRIVRIDTRLYDKSNKESDNNGNV